MPSLYKLSEDYKFLSEYLEASLDNDEVGEDDFEMYKDTLEALEDGIENKCENIVKFMRNLEGDIAAYKVEEQRFSKKRRYMENKQERLKNLLCEYLEGNNLEKLNAGTFKVRLQTNPPSINIIDTKKIPDKYKTAQDPKIDSKALLKDVKNGLVVEGAVLVTDKKHLRIS
ncbi:siphovirus Gp157 family protein [Paenibacillus sp. QZ-Y1]|uniref:siphovirus Gp157 family protein n=1 Tax=Paenibacillus sp. QZ-Y1 TaxID=3414511 RepID=UPI003F798635